MTLSASFLEAHTPALSVEINVAARTTVQLGPDGRAAALSAFTRAVGMLCEGMDGLIGRKGS